jgi:hypothetical protein
VLQCTILLGFVKVETFGNPYFSQVWEFLILCKGKVTVGESRRVPQQGCRPELNLKCGTKRCDEWNITSLEHVFMLL